MLHPLRKAFTYVTAQTASRIDRAYVSAMMSRQVAACRHADHLPPVSDHHPVVLQLLPGSPGVFGPGLKRLRLSFMADAQCRLDMRTWLVQQQPPAGDAAAVLDDWYPTFKTELVDKIEALNALARQRSAAQAGAVARAAAAATLLAAQQQLQQCAEAAVPAALQAVMTAREGFALIQQADEALAQQRRRQQWVHGGERPSPAMSRIMSPPKAAAFIAGLRAPGNGHLVVDGVALSNIVASRYAAVTSAPHTGRPQQDAVLQALVQFSQPLSTSIATALGAAVVTCQEVEAAIAATAPGKAPGLDGIPGELLQTVPPAVCTFVGCLVFSHWRRQPGAGWLL